MIFKNKLNYCLIFCLSLFFASITYSQQLHQLIKPTASADMPAWAKVLYDGTTSVRTIDSSYAIYYQKNAFVKNAYTRYYKKWRYAVQPYVLPDGTIDHAKIQSPPTILAAPQLKNARVAAAGNWTAVGPKIVTEPPYSGVVNTHANVYYVEIAPSNTNIVYCGTEGNGIFKTIDKGLNWTPVAETNPLVGTGPIAIHPTNPNIVMIASGGNIIKTTDGGITWAILKTLPSGEFCEALKLDLINPNNIYAGTNRGLLKSDDGGATWAYKSTGYVWDIQIDPVQNNKIFTFETIAGVANIYKSSDFGSTFTLKNSGWHTGNSDCGLISIAASNPNIIYAASLVYAEGVLKLMKSTDNGETWVFMSAPIDSGQGFYDLGLLVSPTDPQKVATGTVGFIVSSDGGVSFQQLTVWHTDIQNLKAVGNDAWMANDGGLVYSSDFFASTANSRVASNGITDNEFWGFGQGWNTDIMGGGRYHNGNVLLGENAPNGMGYRHGGTEEGTGYVLPYNEDAVIFSSVGVASISSHSASPYGMYPNEDGYGFNASELESDPTCSSTHYLGNGNNLYKSLDKGTTFSKVPSNTAPFDFGDRVRHFEIYRQNPKIIYVSTYSSLWKTIDGGNTWTSITRPVSGSVYSTLSLSFTNSDSLFANFGNTVYLTADGGTTWKNLSTSTLYAGNIRQVIHQAGTNGGIYALIDYSKIYYRDNTMTDWVEFTNNLPANFGFLKGTIFYRDNKLRVAGTKGIWESPLYQNSAPVAQIMADRKLVGCAKKTVNFMTYSVSNKNATYLWTFEGGTPATSTSMYPSVTYNTTGKYDVTLKVTNADGKTSTQTFADFIEYSDADCSIKCEKGFALSPDNLSFILLPAVSSLGSTNSLSVSVWVKPTATSSGLPMALLSNSMQGFGLSLKANTNELIGSWTNNQTMSGATLPVGQWSHVVWTVSPTEEIFYVNGTKYAKAVSHSAINFNDNYTFSWGLGWEGFHLPFGQTLSNFQGEIDEIKVFNRVLTEAEALTNRDISPNILADMAAYVQFNEADTYIAANLVNKQFFDTKSISNTARKVVSTAPVSCPKYVQISPKVFLQAAYNNATGIMSDTLRKVGIIPLKSPYGTSDSTTTAVLSNNLVVDWVNIELRNKKDPKTVLFKKSGLLLTNGTVVSAQALTPITIDGATADSFYVAIRHRNHLGVMTATPIVLKDTATTLVDFTNINMANYKIATNGVPQNTYNGIRMMWAGNNTNYRTVKFSGTQNNVEEIYQSIMGDPANVLKLSSFLRKKAYLPEDINMDGTVNYLNDTAKILNIVLGHPNNVLGLSIFFITEQIPY